MKKALFLPLVSTITLGAVSGTIIGIKLSKIKRWYEYEDWYRHCSSSKLGESATIYDIGQLVPIIVNNQIHQVRLIGIDHDNLANEQGKAHCTFEFKDLLSDSSGHSLATFWNINDGENSDSSDFLNSDIRYALDGKTEDSNKTDDAAMRLHWYQKNSTIKAEAPYNVPVINMLPSALVSSIKEVYKLSAIGKNYTFDLIAYKTKLFILAANEMTCGRLSNKDNIEGTTYKYYEKCGLDDDLPRKKGQVKAKESCLSTVNVNHHGDINWDDLQSYNYAGFSQIEGSFYWTRSSFPEGRRATFIDSHGHFSNREPDIITYILPIAPAFCI